MVNGCYDMLRRSKVKNMLFCIMYFKDIVQSRSKNIFESHFNLTHFFFKSFDLEFYVNSHKNCIVQVISIGDKSCLRSYTIKTRL